QAAREQFTREVSTRQAEIRREMAIDMLAAEKQKINSSEVREQDVIGAREEVKLAGTVEVPDANKAEFERAEKNVNEAATPEQFPTAEKDLRTLLEKSGAKVTKAEALDSALAARKTQLDITLAFREARVQAEKAGVPFTYENILNGKIKVA